MTPYLDGYNRHIKLGDMHFHYRPATRRERDQFSFVGRKLGDVFGRRAVFRFVAEHLVTSDIAIEASSIHLEILNKDHPMAFDDLFRAIQGTIPDSSGKRWVDIEHDWQRNLYGGVIFESRYPQLAKRSCDDCRKWWFRGNSLEILKSATTGERLLRHGEVACESGIEPGCPKGRYDNQRGLNVANKWAFAHWKECVAIGHFPDDPIVKQNAVIIQRALSIVARSKGKKVAR